MFNRELNMLPTLADVHNGLDLNPHDWESHFGNECCLKVARLHQTRRYFGFFPRISPIACGLNKGIIGSLNVRCDSHQRVACHGCSSCPVMADVCSLPDFKIPYLVARKPAVLQRIYRTCQTRNIFPMGPFSWSKFRTITKRQRFLRQSILAKRPQFRWMSYRRS